MIADSSVWINWLRRGDSWALLRLDQALARRDVLMLPVILQEILQGAATEDRFRAWQRALAVLPVGLVTDPAATAVAWFSARCHCHYLPMRVFKLSALRGSYDPAVSR